MPEPVSTSLSSEDEGASNPPLPVLSGKDVLTEAHVNALLDQIKSVTAGAFQHSATLVAMGGNVSEQFVAQSVFLSRVASAIRTAQAKCRTGDSMSVAEISDKLHRSRISSTLFEECAALFSKASVTLTPLSYEALQHDVLESAYRDLHTCNFSMGGQRVICDILERNARGLDWKKVDLTTLSSLQTRARKELGADCSSVVSLLFLLAKGDLETVSNYIRIEADLPNDDRREPFRREMRYLGIVGDVTAAIHEESGDAERARTAFVMGNTIAQAICDKRIRTGREHCEQIGVSLFSITAEHIGELEAEENPWFTGYVSKTMFDKKKIGCMLSPEVPREAIAGVIKALNRFNRVLECAELNDIIHSFKNKQNPKARQKIMERADAVVQSMGQVDELLDYEMRTTSEEGVRVERKRKIDVRGTLEDKVNGLRWQIESTPAIAGTLLERLRRWVVENELEIAEDADADADIAALDYLEEAHIQAGEIMHLRDSLDVALSLFILEFYSQGYHPDDAPILKLEGGTPVSDIEYMMSEVTANEFLDEMGTGGDTRDTEQILKKIEPEKKIAFLRTLLPQEKLADPYEAIPLVKGESVLPSHVFVRLLDMKAIVHDPMIQPQFLDLFRRLQREKSDVTEILERSIVVAIHPDGEPDADVGAPLDADKSKRSIRDCLALLAQRRCSDDALCRGPQNPKAQSIGVSKPIIPLVNRNSLRQRRAQSLYQDFDTATTGILVQRYIDDARAWLREKEDPYRSALAFADQSAEAYFKTGGGYHYHYFGGALEAMQSLQLRIFSNLRKSFDHAVIGEHEYGPMVEHFVENGAGVRHVYANHKDGTPKTPAEFMKDVRTVVSPRTTQMFLLSLQTRLGGAPLACGHDRTHTYYVARFAEMFRELFPEIAFAIDDAQGIGRGVCDGLKVIKPDIYFTTAGKALGGHNIGIMALSKEYQKRMRETRGKSYRYTSPTLLEEDLVAAGIAMRHLRQPVDYWRTEGNTEGNKYQSVEQKIGRHMTTLTRSIIKQAEEYGATFDRTYITDRRIPGIGDVVSPVETFGCEVVRPEHRSQRDYSGIVTLRFPAAPAHMLIEGEDINGQKFGKGLRELGFSVHPCLQRQSGMRISCHYLHEFTHLEVLFDAIRDVHVELLARDIHMGDLLRSYKALKRMESD